MVGGSVTELEGLFRLDGLVVMVIPIRRVRQRMHCL